MRVALFTRWPEPGRAKTRLISALGAQGAADLHRRLTERTVATVRASGLACELRSTGAPVAEFEGWLARRAPYFRHSGEGRNPVASQARNIEPQTQLGSGLRRNDGNISVVDQGDGNLGERLARAAADLPVLLIGADCPGLTPAHLQRAATALASAPAVIGPAEDGGYWLLGLAAPADVFTGIDWGSDTVFAATCARLPAATVVLDTLADLDRPEDLARWPGV